MPHFPFFRRFAGKDQRTLLDNFYSLSILQASQYLLPLVTFPYLVRVLGPAPFGLLAFAKALIQYLVIITNYGFDMSATRDIALHRGDREAVNRIFSVVLCIRLGLLLLSALFLACLTVFVPRIRDESALFWIYFLMVAGNVLFPVWLFQGLEKMVWIPRITVGARLLYTILIFALVRDPSHYRTVAFLDGASILLMGAAALLIARRRFGVRWRGVGFADIGTALRGGWHIFISFVAINAYKTVNTLILGFFTSYTVVGFYAAAEKILTLCVSLFSPAVQAAFPFMSKIAGDSRVRAMRILRQITAWTLTGALVLWVLVMLIPDNLIQVILGEAFRESLVLLQLMSPLVILLPLAAVFSTLGMIPLQLDRHFSKVYLQGAALNLVLILVLLGVLRLEAAGAALTTVVVEAFITVRFFLHLRREGRKP